MKTLNRYGVRLFSSTLFFLLLLNLPLVNAETLEGTVVNPSGDLVQSASVILVPGENTGGNLRGVRSDEQGRFTFQNVASGDYLIYAEKEAAGLPDVVFSFFGVGQPRPQNIKISEPLTTTIVKVGQPDGKLKCTVEDEYGHRIAGAQYRLFTEDNPEILIISGADRNGEIATLVPGVPIILQMEAAGFKPWRSEPMAVRTDEVKSLTIKLRK